MPPPPQKKCTTGSLFKYFLNPSLNSLVSPVVVSAEESAVISLVHMQGTELFERKGGPFGDRKHNELIILPND